MIPTNVATQGLAFGAGTLSIATQGFLPTRRRTAGGGARRPRRPWLLPERPRDILDRQLELLERRIRELEALREQAEPVPAQATPATAVDAYATELDAAKRAAAALQRVTSGEGTAEADLRALNAILRAARVRLLREEDAALAAAAKRLHNAWRAALLVLLWVMS